MRALQVKDTDTGDVVHHIDVTGHTDRSVERVTRGMLINMNRDRFIVVDTAWQEEEAGRAALHGQA